MSYLVLARKYRPKNFTQMVGQEHVVQALTNALTQQRLHHAYLFTGTRGVGKTTVSRILAKSLNCQGADGLGGITAEPCGVCSACTDIDSGRFVDYTELDAASNRGVDEVQSLLEQAVYKPVQGRFKVFMIDEVHMLTNTAFNAMLKTLEEPPEYLKFVLATTDPQKVPVTVLSRCLQFNLRPMAPETIQAHLHDVLLAESVPADAQALRLISRAARGSMRDALSLTDQAIAFGSGQLQDATVRLMLGSVDRSHVFRLIQSLAVGDGKTVVQTVETLRFNGLSAASSLEEMCAVLQRMAVIQSVPDMAHAEDDEASQVVALAQQLPADETQLLYSLCLHGRAELGLAPDDYAALTMVLLRLLAFKPPGSSAVATPSGQTAEKKTLAFNASVPAVDLQQPEPLESADRPLAHPLSGRVLPVIEQSATRLALPTQQIQASNEPAKIPASPVFGVPVREQIEGVSDADNAARAPVTLQATEEGDFWHGTVQQLVAAESIVAMVRELALQSQLIARDTGHWMLRVERASLNQPASRERLQVALAAAGHAVTLGVEVGTVSDTPARRNTHAADEKQKAAEAIFLTDPFVQKMMQDYGGKILPGSIKPVLPFPPDTRIDTQPKGKIHV
jgi:DNA polymerase III subunit gamma/tau